MYSLATNIKIESDIIGFDIETSPYDEFKHEEGAALDETKAFIAGFSIAIPSGDAWYFPLRHRGYNILENEAKEVLEYLSGRSLFVIHNAEFEKKFLMQHGFPLPKRYICTLTLARLLRIHSTGLKYIAKVILQRQRESFEKVCPNGCFADLSVSQKVINYACGDADDALQFYLLIRDKFPAWMQQAFALQEKQNNTLCGDGGINMRIPKRKPYDRSKLKNTLNRELYEELKEWEDNETNTIHDRNV